MPNSQSPMGLGHLIFLAAFENLCQVPVCMFRCSKTFVSLSCGAWSVWVRAELQQIPSGEGYLGLNLSWATSRVPSPAEGHHMSFVILLYAPFGRLTMGKAERQRASALPGATERDPAVKTLPVLWGFLGRSGP